ncbi:MAG: ATP-binding protein [Ardenticatenaceae bacterium]|nr:ATP-binding protein [Ardenticatenaceae bacterium]
MTKMQLIVFSGLPGTGKSMLAEAVARQQGIPVFAKDWLEAVLLDAGLTPTERLGYAGYDLLTTLARRQLSLGQSAILDSVASFERIRAHWRELAYEFSAQWRVVECVCSDEVAHRERLNGRQRHIPGWHELTWADVERVHSYYEPWLDERLVVDGIRPFADNLQVVLTYLQS